MFRRVSLFCERDINRDKRNNRDTTVQSPESTVQSRRDKVRDEVPRSGGWSIPPGSRQAVRKQWTWVILHVGAVNPLILQSKVLSPESKVRDLLRNQKGD